MDTFAATMSASCYHFQQVSLAILLFHEIASFEYKNWRKLTTSLSELIKDESKVYHVNKIDWRKIESDLRFERERCYKNTLNKLRNNMSDMKIQLNKISQEKGVSNWLTSDAISKPGFNLNK